MPFINFDEVELLATIEQLAQMLGLRAKQSGRQLRCVCPIHGGDDRTLAITPDVRSKRGSEGVFFCQKSKSGGDRIGLVAHCMDIGQQDAAFFIAEQFGTEDTVNSTTDRTVPRNSRATVPQKNERRANVSNSKKEVVFDAEAFALKLEYSDDTMRALLIGTYRGREYFGHRYSSGVIAGFSYRDIDGNMVAPKVWQPDASNVVKLKRA